MMRNHRRSSAFDSSASLSSRKSSSARDLERMQLILQRREWSSAQIVVAIFALPISSLLYTHIINEYSGNLNEFISNFDLMAKIGLATNPCTSVAWRTLSFVVLLQLFFVLNLPTRTITIRSCTGEKCQKEINSLPSVILIALLFVMGSMLGFYRAELICIHWTSIIFLLNISSFAAAILLQLKRILWDNSYPNLNEFFFGAEVSPTMFDIEIKPFTTYRICLTLWTIYIVSALDFARATHGRLSVELTLCAILHLIYIARNLWLEHLHYTQLDFQMTHCGFYRIWCATTLLPALYVTPISLLSRKPSLLSQPITIVFFISGLLAIYLNTETNIQRYNFRMNNGNVKIWGRDPFFIRAKFRRDNGEIGANLLLGSGWWGLSRHPNYLTEWLTFAAWTLLQGSNSIFTYLPILYMIIFFYERIVNDEFRCQGKYGNHWLQYTNRVNYAMIPSLF